MDAIKPSFRCPGVPLLQTAAQTWTTRRVFVLIARRVAFATHFSSPSTNPTHAAAKAPRISVTSVPRDWLLVGRITMRPSYQMWRNKTVGEQIKASPRYWLLRRQPSVKNPPKQTENKTNKQSTLHSVTQMVEMVVQ